MTPLSQEHHITLNHIGPDFKGGPEARQALIRKLRGEYPEDVVALRELDIYDERQLVVHRHRENLVNALRSRDDKKADEEIVWLNDYIPNGFKGH